MSKKTKKKESLKVLSKKPSYDIPIRAISGNTNPRNPLSSSLQDQGWDCMSGEQQIWSLAVSENAEERAKYVQLIQDFDPEICSLAATILSQGLMEPVEVCEGGGGKFRLVFGARRCLAILFNWCLLAKPKEPIVQAFLVKGNTSHLLHRAAVENIRKPQSIIEEARVIEMSINNGEAKEEVARQLGMSVATVNSRLSLLTLDPKVQKKLHEGQMTAGKAKRDDAEKNGKPRTQADESADNGPRLRKKKEIQEAAEEFKEGSKERKVLDWVLGIADKIE